MKGNREKEYIVIGMGRFGSSVAKQLEANGCHVLAVDRDEKLVRQIAEYVTLALCVDVSNEEAMEDLGGRSFDGAVLSIGNNLEASVLATIWAKEQGIPQVVAKARDETHGKILMKLGVDEVVCPEKEMGVRLANDLAFSRLFDAIELTSEYSITDLPSFSGWAGKDLKELKLREKYGVNVIAIRRRNDLLVNPRADEPLQEDDALILLGANHTLKKIAAAHSSEKKGG